MGISFIVVSSRENLMKATVDHFFGDIGEAIESAKKAMESDDPSTMKSASDNLTQTSHKLAEAMYAKASQGAGGAQAETAQGQESAGESKGSEEEVVDADFEEVKDDQS